MKSGPKFNEPRTLTEQLEAAVAYQVEANRQLRAVTWSTKPHVTDEQLEAVHDQLQQVCTEPELSELVPEGAVWFP